jgi:hypothetical protein
MLEHGLRVDDKVLKAVVFIGREADGGFTPYGTALIGLIKCEDFSNTVIVTARHVVDNIKRHNTERGGSLVVRVNRKDGSSEPVKLKSEIIENRVADLCIFLQRLDPTIYDIWAYHLDSSEWNDRVRKVGLPQPGEEVCVAGLYTTHYGHIKNMPVVRIGNIAAVPDEPLIHDFGSAHGYLIECYSILGLSGSPVFKAVQKLVVNADKSITHIESMYVLIGILIGYHVTGSEADEIIVPEYQLPVKPRKGTLSPLRVSEQRRTGFAVVIAIQYIFSVFESEPFVSMLKSRIAEVREKIGFRPASATGPLASDENPNHREDFTSLLSAAVRKREQER